MKHKDERQKIIEMDEFTIVIRLPDKGKDIRYAKDNNILCLKNGEVIWRIGELLNNYAKKNHLNDYQELYFDIIKVDDKTIKCTGFLNHCMIDIYQKEIISIINNR